MKELLILQKNRRVIPTRRPKTQNHCMFMATIVFLYVRARTLYIW